MHPRAEKLVAQICEVCPLPASADRIMALTSAEATDLKEITRVLAQDPAMASEVLRIANSAAYARIQRIGDLGRAVLFMGLRELHDMAAGMALIAAFRTEAELGLQFHGSCVLSGSISRLVATEMKNTDRGMAFLSGLLCEIGAMACLAVDGRVFMQLWSRSAGSWESRLELEREHYKASSFEIGGRLLKRNKLPEEIGEAVECVPDADRSTMNTLMKLTVFSRQASQLIIRAQGAGKPGEAEEQLPALFDWAGLTGVGSDRLVEICRDASAESSPRVSA